MTDRELLEVRVGALGEAGHDVGGEFLRLLAGLERQLLLLHGESEDVRVHQCRRVSRRRQREPGLPQASQHRLVVGQRRRPRLRARPHQAQRPRVSSQYLAHRVGAVLHGASPVGVVGDLDLGEHRVDHAVEDVVLARDVVIQRHGLDPELLSEAPHGHRAEALGVGQGHGRTQRAVPGHGLAPLLGGTCAWRHLWLPSDGLDSPYNVWLPLSQPTYNVR